MAKAKKDKIRETEITENLKCMLTEDEVKQAGEAMAKFVQDTARLEGDLKSIKASFKAKIEAAAAGIIDNSNKVRDKYEYRDVDCMQSMNFTVHTIKVTRADTKIVIENRKMTNKEKMDEKLWDAKAKPRAE